MYTRPLVGRLRFLSTVHFSKVNSQRAAANNLYTFYKQVVASLTTTNYKPLNLAFSLYIELHD